MLRAHKIRIFPSKDQEILLRKSCGVARFSYNWALAQWKQMYENKEKVNEGLLRKKLVSVKRTEFPWMMEVTKCAPEQAIKNLGTAFSKFFKKKTGFPKFKKKGCGDSFYVSNDKFAISGKSLRLPKIGNIQAAEELRFSGKIMSGTVSLDVDRWYISILVDTEEQLERIEDKGIVGVDLGIKTLATFSDEVVFENPKFYNKALRRIQRLSRSLARKIKGGNNRNKAKLRLVRTHRKVRLARKTNLHKISTYLCTRYSTVVLEDLNVQGMVKNHKLARAISDCGFGTFRAMVENKAKQTKTKVVFADRFYPSSKTCSCCGFIKEDLLLSHRIYKCINCGFEADRDLNAAINLKKLGTCCSEVKPVETSVSESVKQEFLLTNGRCVNDC
jgi:putative transposase